MSNYYNNNNKSSFKSASYSSKNINQHGNKSAFEDEDIIIIGTTPSISTSFSPIDINIVIPKTSHFNEIKTDYNCQYLGQHNSLYYQPQTATDLSYFQPQPDKYTQRQQYCQDRITQQDCYINDYDSDKVGKRGNVHSGIPTSEKKSTHYSIGE